MMKKPTQQIEKKIEDKENRDKRSSLEDEWRDLPIFFTEHCYSVVIPHSRHEANNQPGERKRFSEKAFEITS